MSTSEYTLSVRLRTTIERYWLRSKSDNVQQTIVQSPSMADAVRRCLGLDPAIAPFAATLPSAPHAINPVISSAPDPVFLYVASGEPHKNHLRLVEAWEHMATAGMNPLLRLTLNPVHHPALTAWIENRSKRFGLRIENIGGVTPDRIPQLYADASALIYPSFAESLGLPLLEARALGLPIIASERDFVRDIVVPHQTFDPESAISISRAIRRFLSTAEPPLKIKTPAEFLNLVLGD